MLSTEQKLLKLLRGCLICAAVLAVQSCATASMKPWREIESNLLVSCRKSPSPPIASANSAGEISCADAMISLESCALEYASCKKRLDDLVMAVCKNQPDAAACTALKK